LVKAYIGIHKVVGKMESDANLSPWLEELDSSVCGLSAKLSLAPGWYGAFQRHLQENPDARRLVHAVLPKCRARHLAEFVMLVVSGIERALIPLTREWGRGLRKIVDSAARKDRSIRNSIEAQKLVRAAGIAFDTRRESLAEYCYGALILRRYLHFRSGVEPTARELAALLSAGLAAGGRLQPVDHDLLRRNLKNYETKHPHPLATGERCAQIIELTASTPTTA
jgi:hypothetical protein